MKKLLEVTNEETKNLNDVAQDLRELSEAFAKVGNHHLEMELHDMAGFISKSSEAIDKAVSDNLHKEFKQSQEFSGTLLKTALAGIKIGKEES